MALNTPIQKPIQEAANVAAPQDTSGTVARQIAAASTGKVGTDMGGAQTNAATSATINTVQGRIEAGKTAALQRAQNIKQKRDVTLQQGEAQQQQLTSQRASLSADAEQQAQNIYAQVSEAGKDMNHKEKIAAGEQLDFMDQMKHDKTQADVERVRQARRNMTTQERRKSNALAGQAQALEDAIQEALFMQSEAKKTRDYNEANNLQKAIDAHKDNLAKINDNQNALMTSAIGSAAKAGVAYGDSTINPATGEKTKKSNWTRDFA